MEIGVDGFSKYNNAECYTMIPFLMMLAPNLCACRMMVISNLKLFAQESGLNRIFGLICELCKSVKNSKSSLCSFSFRVFLPPVVFLRGSLLFAAATTGEADARNIISSNDDRIIISCTYLQPHNYS